MKSKNLFKKMILSIVQVINLKIQWKLLILILEIFYLMKKEKKCEKIWIYNISYKNNFIG